MFSVMFVVWGLIAVGIVVSMGLVFNKKIPIWESMLLFVGFYIFSWLTLPSLSIDMVDSWFVMFAIVSIAAFITLVNSNSNKVNGKVILIPVTLLLVFMGGLFFTSSIFTSTQRANVIKVVNHGQKDTTINLVSQSQALRVTRKLAAKRAAELMGSSEDKALASVFEFGDYYGDLVKGRAVWIAPLQPQSFFRWMSSGTSPGYFITSHVNVMDSSLVEDKPINYGTSGYFFGHDLHRHIYSNGYVNYSYGDSFFQLDDNSDPYYVVALERPQVGFSSYFPEKWLTVNAGTGDIKEYDNPEKLPGWVSKAFPEDTIESRIEDWGCYSYGWWKCNISGVGVIVPTPGMTVTMNGDNKLIYYTGTQFSNNKSEGATSGLTIANSRTGKVDFYRRSGITETSAKNIIDGAVANFAGRTAEDPVLIQVNGLETYFSVITDSGGARKGFGMVWQRNRNVFGVGTSVNEAIRAYLRSVRNNKKLGAFNGNVEIEMTEFKGIVVSISSVIRGGETSFYLRIDTVKDKVFVVNTDNPAEVATTNAGDLVLIKTANANPSTIEVDYFDNTTFSLLESNEQILLDRYSNDVDKENIRETQAGNLKSKIKGLSAEDVKKLLKNIK